LVTLDAGTKLMCCMYHIRKVSNFQFLLAKYQFA
jgi:hypothetical protein